MDTSHETKLDRLARLRVDLFGQVGQSHFNVHQSMGRGWGETGQWQDISGWSRVTERLCKFVTKSTQTITCPK